MASQQQEWKWEDDYESFHSFQDNISPDLDKLNIGECYTMHFRNNQYEIKKISKNKCTQRNTETNHTRNVMLKSSKSIIKIGPKKKKNHSNFHWYWKDDNEQFHAYSAEVSMNTEKLNIGDSYYVFLDDITYSITKTAKNTAQQTDLRTYETRNVIRQNKIKQSQNNINAFNDQIDDVKQDYKSDEVDGSNIISWYWKDDKDQFTAFDSVVSNRISHLNTGGSMMHNTEWSQYKLTKLSKSKGEQRNTESNGVREIRRMSSNQAQKYNQNPSKYPRKHQNKHPKYPVQNDDDQNISDDEKQTAPNKWYFEDDKGEFNPMDDWLSRKIDNLTIGDIMNEKIHNSTYQFKKTGLKKGTQRNVDTNKVRAIRCGEYGWFFEENDKSLKPYSDDLSKRVEATSINSPFTFSRNIHKYSITKLSKNHAKQKNVSTKVERNVVRKMTLNDNNDQESDESNADWLRKRYKKAMKAGKMDRVHLICKRTLHENWADNIFRTCESQFVRSCDGLGKGNNGLNKTIKEVEFIINPTLINKFEGKKKQIMKKNACKESDLNIILCWHGTPSANLENIIKKNFDISKLGDNKNNKGFYGCGIYFSEFLRISKNYGDGMLLCKVILGKEYKMKFGKPEIGRTLESGYDSHVAVKPNSDYGREVCVFDVDQILPCYIVKY